MSRRLFAIAAGCLAAVGPTLTSCWQRDYAFEVRAIYEAPETGYRMVVETVGRVEAGDDISDDSRGSVEITPTRSSAPARIRLAFATDGSVTYRLGNGDSGAVEWDWRSAESALRGLLVSAGYDASASEEVAESVRAITGALAGPKGTLLPGQTSALEVVAVDL